MKLFDIDAQTYEALLEIDGGKSIVHSDRDHHDRSDIERWLKDKDINYMFIGSMFKGNSKLLDVWYISDQSHRMEFTLRWV